MSQEQQQKQCDDWNHEIAGPCPFAPHEFRNSKNIVERNIIENRKLGEFASQQMRKIFEQSKKDAKIFDSGGIKRVVNVGWGKGDDSKWLNEATLAGYGTVCIDVASIPCTNARRILGLRWDKIRDRPSHVPPPEVIQGDIRSILLDPEPVGLDIPSVKLWYFCRTLTCLDQESAHIVLNILGESLCAEHNRDGLTTVLIISPMWDYNYARVSRRTKLYPIKEIVSMLSYGAGCEVEVADDVQHMYYDQTYSALTMRVK
ncbi:MAG: hypothetical protein WDN09_02570 [bacterium]